MFGVGAVKSAGDTEALKLGLEAVTGSAEKAGKRFKELQELAKLPGLGLEQAVEADISLQATGLAAETSAKSIKQFGNAIASVGKGPEQLKQALYGVQQLANTDFPLGEDLNIIKEAVPQVSKLLKEAFGTARSEELQKLGVSSQEVLSTILTGLEKLPRVAGGINNTFTNVFDGIKQNLSAFGESIVKNLNVQAIAQGFSAALDSITNAFTNLSPSVQKGILVFAGLAAAIGPIALAIGGVISILPTLAAGFAVITGPIGLAVGAIAAGAYLIISNWESVTAYFKNSGLASVFSELGNAISGSINALVDYIKDFANSVKPIWEGVTTFLGSALGQGLKFAGTVLSSAFNVFTRVLQTFGAVFRGDWQAVFNGIGNITVSVFNGITKILTGFASGAIRIVGSIAKALGTKTLANTFEGGAAAVEKFGKSLQLAYYGNETLVKSNESVAKSFEQVTKAAQQTFIRTPKVAKGKDPKKQDPGIKDLNYHLSTTGFNKAIDDIEALNDKVGNGKGYEVPIKLSLPQNIAAEFGAFKANIAAQMTGVGDVVLETTGLVQQALGDTFALIGETLGQAISGNFQGIQSFFKGFLNIVFDFAATLGKTLIGLGLATLSLKQLGINPVAAVIAGTALIALAGAAKSLLGKGPNFSGGGSSGGGGSATGSRPAYNSPASGSNYQAPQSATSSTQEFKIRGTDLVAVIKQTAFNKDRVG
ncbi:tape measure protein [Adhaeribacter pallidiroseus]|uniref:tape measure protein n=1 Tax=Adhaeribacter pallidiroseus TaxID=2072847 RepID=UPI001F1AE026|nr:tape measure protein [Adhaeribacter pallidiroseus]